MKTLPGITGLEYCTKGIGVQTRDPIIQSPGYSQSYNGYSYCFNNPLKYIDPSGYLASAQNDDPDPWAIYIKACMRNGYTGGYANFLYQFYEDYYFYLFAGGGGGFSGGGAGSFKMTLIWQTGYSWIHYTAYNGSWPVATVAEKVYSYQSATINVNLRNSDSFNNATNGRGTPWMNNATSEMRAGVFEIPGQDNNQKILNYFKPTVYIPTSDDPPNHWCAAFVNSMLELNSIKGTRTAWAPDFLNWGVHLDGFRYGAPVVVGYLNGDWTHVGFAVLETDTYVRILGGNQGPYPHGVTESNFMKTSYKFDYRRPYGY